MLARMSAMRNLLSASLWLLATLSCGWAQTNVDFQRTEDVVYGRKFGTALTLDVFQPRPANGVGIVLMVSGGWHSAHESINPSFKDMEIFADWYDQYLRGIQPKP
jgi:hypothetical protein